MDKNQQTTKVPKRDGETSQLSSVQGVPAARPKLISLALLWSAGQWGNKEGEWKSDGRVVSRKWNSLGN